MGQRREKKSESIEIRVSHDVKEAFLRKASQEGRSVSDILRQSIRHYLNGKDEGRLRGLLWKPALTIGTAAGVLLIAYTISSPAGATPDMRLGFKALDKDHDGFVDPREFADQRLLILRTDGFCGEIVAAELKDPSDSLDSSVELRAEFAGADANKDRTISLKEFVAYRRSGRRRNFVLTDLNADGRVSLIEFCRKPGMPGGTSRKLFVSRDTNHDGWLSEEELGRAFRLRITDNSRSNSA